MSTRIIGVSFSLARVLIGLFFICAPLVSLGQEQLQDIVYLKNGGIIRGDIIEQIPNQTIKIRTADGSVFVYTMTEIEKITKGSGLRPPVPLCANRWAVSPHRSTLLVFSKSVPPFKRNSKLRRALRSDPMCDFSGWDW